jgi:hypothetical protein
VFGHREQYGECTETPVPVSLRLERPAPTLTCYKADDHYPDQGLALLGGTAEHCAYINNTANTVPCLYLVEVISRSESHD